MAGVKVPVPEWGRDYVLQLLMPDAAAELELPTIYGPMQMIPLQVHSLLTKMLR